MSYDAASILEREFTTVKRKCVSQKSSCLQIMIVKEKSFMVRLAPHIALRRDF